MFSSMTHLSRCIAYLIVCGTLLANVRAQTTTVIAANEAAAHVNQYATVEGIVAKLFTSKAGNTFLNIGAAYPNQTFHRLDSAVLRPKANSLSPKLTGSCSGDLLNACLDFEPLTDLYTSTCERRVKPAIYSSQDDLTCSRCSGSSSSFVSLLLSSVSSS
jgi:hypothetical protein